MNPSRNQDKISMNAATYDARVTRWSKQTWETRRKRRGIAPDDAQTELARELKVSPGRVERARKGRIKNSATWFYERVRAAFIRELEAEIARLSQEIFLARQSGMDARDEPLEGAEAALASVRKLIEEARR
jgi:hypothetical protein